MQLTRRFSPWLMLILSINGTIGSAWLFAPWYAAKIAGTGAIYAWLLSGLATMLVALCFAELSCLFPMTGGSAALPALSHGRLTSFVVSWTAWLSALTMSPIEVQAILQYASIFFPSLMISKHGVASLSVFGFMWAAALMLCFCVINISSAKGFGRINALLFIFKIGIIFLTIYSIIFQHFHVSNFYQPLLPGANNHTNWHAIFVATATGGVAFAFTGFKHGVELAGEAKNARWGIPLAIVGSVCICLLIYLGLQIAFIGALSPAQLSKGWAAVSFSGDVGPFAGLAIALGMPILAKLLYADAVISPAGAGLVYMTSTARILYAMSEIGYIPACFKRLNAHGFPVIAILFNFLLGMLLFLPLKGWQSLVGFLVSGMVISYAMGPITLLCFRAELPNRHRSFKLPFAKLGCFFAFYFCNLLCYWTGWDTLLKFAIAILLGLICFFIYYLKTKKTADIKSSIWLIPYLFGLVIISYLGSFGGNQLIPFGWDFLVIGLFSICILSMAYFCRIKNLEKHQSMETIIRGACVDLV